MPPEIKRITDQFLQAAVQVEVSRPATAASTITQRAVIVPGGEWSKRETLRRLIREEGVKNAIVFCNRKRDVDTLAQSLQKHGFSAAALHGDLDQSVRTRTLDAFRAGQIAILVASDVAARGLDIPAVSHIFNFDVPRQPDDYVHRIGRTGRAGRPGDALTLVGRGEEKYLSAIENLGGKAIERRRMEGLPEELPRRIRQSPITARTNARPYPQGKQGRRGRACQSAGIGTRKEQRQAARKPGNPVCRYKRCEPASGIFDASGAASAKIGQETRGGGCRLKPDAAEFIRTPFAAARSTKPRHF